MSPGLKRFSAVYVSDTEIRRLTFEAKDEAEAKRLATKWGVGIEGETNHTETPTPLPEAYDQETARRLLGGISRTTLYAELCLGRLERVPDIRRVLITRRSLERRCGAN